MTFDVRREASGFVLLVRAIEKNRGLNYIRLGLRLESDFEGASAFDFALNHVMYPINPMGGMAQRISDRQCDVDRVRAVSAFGFA